MCRAVRGPPKRAAAGKAPNYMLMPHSTLSSSGASLRVCIFARICGQACDMSKTHKVTKATPLGWQKGPWKVVRGKGGKQRGRRRPSQNFTKIEKRRRKYSFLPFPISSPIIYVTFSPFSFSFSFTREPICKCPSSFSQASGAAADSPLSPPASVHL